MSSCLWPMESYDSTVFDFKLITWNNSKAMLNESDVINREISSTLKNKTIIYNDHPKKGVTPGKNYSHLKCDLQPKPSGHPGGEGRGRGHMRTGRQLWSSASPERVPPDRRLRPAAWGRRRCWRNTPSVVLLAQCFVPLSRTGRSWSPLMHQRETWHVKLNAREVPTHAQ